MADGINYTGDFPCYVLDRLCDNLTDNLKEMLTIGVFSIVFVMSVIEKFTEFLNTLTTKYELRIKCWINTIVMIQSVPHCLC